MRKRGKEEVSEGARMSHGKTWKTKERRREENMKPKARGRRVGDKAIDTGE